MIDAFCIRSNKTEVVLVVIVDHKLMKLDVHENFDAPACIAKYLWTKSMSKT